MTVFGTLAEGAMRRISEIKSCCVTLNQSLNDCRVHLCSTHSCALESLVGALGPYSMGRHLTSQWELASILQERCQSLLILTTAWTVRWVKASSLLHILLISWLSLLSREGSLQQGAEETWSGSFSLKMRWEWVNCAVRVMLKDYNSVQKATAALCMGSPRKSIPEQCPGWWLETEGTWRICTTPSIEITFNLRKIRLSQSPLTRVPV